MAGVDPLLIPPAVAVLAGSVRLAHNEDRTSKVIAGILFLLGIFLIDVAILI